MMRYELNKPLASVKPFFDDLIRFGALHPLLKKVKPIGNKLYRVTEKVKNMPFTFSYNASVEILEESVIYYIKSPFFSFIIQFSFSETSKNDYCIIEERVENIRPKIVSSFLMGMILKNHRIIFEKLSH